MELDADSNYTLEEQVIYGKIKKYVKKKYGVNTKYITRAKRMCELDISENHNKSKKENPDVKHCTPEKIECIKEVLQYYQLLVQR